MTWLIRRLARRAYQEGYAAGCSAGRAVRQQQSYAQGYADGKRDGRRAEQGEASTRCAHLREAYEQGVLDERARWALGTNGRHTPAA